MSRHKRPAFSVLAVKSRRYKDVGTSFCRARSPAVKGSDLALGFMLIFASLESAMKHQEVEE